jgi:ISXO2-like transposase domain
MTATSMPAVKGVYQLLFDEEYCKRFLFNFGVFYNERACPKCSISMKFYITKEAFRCTKKGCGGYVSMKSNSFFSKCHLGCAQVMHLAYLWLTKARIQTAELHTGHSRETVCAYYGYFRELIAGDVPPESVKIGGDDVIVELDESKIAKRKYNRGHHVEGVWLLGGVERTPEKKTFFVPIESRDENTLLDIIERHVLPGSIVHTDLWRGYYNLESELGLRHLTVNHSIQFVNPENGVHTNTIEGTWNGLKLFIPPRSRVKDGIENKIAEFQWRRIHESDLWNAFLQNLKDTHYD